MFHRRGRAVGARRLARSDAGRLLRPRHRHVEDDRTNYLFQQPYGSALFTLFPARQAPDAAAAASSSRSGRRSRAKGVPVGRDPVHARRRCRAWAPTSPTCTRRARSGSTGARRPAMRAAAASSAPRCTTTGSDDAFGFQLIEYEGIQHLPILREAWVLSLRGRVQTASAKDGQQIPFFMLPALGGGSTLRGYSSWRFRDRNSLLLQAEWRIMVNRYLDLAFFYDAGKVTARTSRSRPRRAEGRLSVSASASTARSRRRCASKWPGAAKAASPSSFRLVGSFLRVAPCHISSVSHHVHVAPRYSASSVAAIGLFSAASSTQARASTLTIRSRASPNRRTRRRRAAYEQSQMYELVYNLFVTSGYKPSGLRAKNINTIDEVPDSSWFTNRIGTQADHDRRARARRQRRRAARSVEVGADPRKDARAPTRASPRGTPRARPGSSSSIRRTSRKGATAAVAIATKIFWALGYNQVESFITTLRSEEDDDRSEGDGRAVRTASARPSHRTTSTPFSSTWRATRTAPTASSPAGCCRARSSATSTTPARGPTIPTISCRTSTGASCGRCASSARGPTSPTSRRANTLDTLVTENGKTIVKHYLQDVGSTFGMCQRQARVGPRATSTSTRAGPVAEAPVHARVRAEPVADRPLCRVPVGRQVRRRRVRSEEVAAADADRPPTWRCATTTRSGRRGGSRPSPTS